MKTARTFTTPSLDFDSHARILLDTVSGLPAQADTERACRDALLLVNTLTRKRSVESRVLDELSTHCFDATLSQR